MKKFVFTTIIAGTTICSSIGIMFLGCGQDKIGSGGTGNSTGLGGIGGMTPISLPDASVIVRGGGSGQTVTADANCGSATSSTSQTPADVLLVLDRSGSMDYSIAEDCYCDAAKAGRNGSVCSNTSNCSARWPTLTSAINTTLSGTAGVSWGLKLFSSVGGANNCAVSNTVEVSIGANSAAAVQQLIASPNVIPGGYTPTTKAINAARDYLKTVTDANNKVILLATDGEPNCQGNSENTNDDTTGAKTAIAAAYAAGYKVYVVGMGPQAALKNLQDFAVAGGTDNYYPANSPQALADALLAISHAIAECTFTVTAPANGTTSVAVYLNGTLAPSTDWTYTASTQTIAITGTTCDTIKNGTPPQTVQVYFGCGEGPPPPIL